MKLRQALSPRHHHGIPLVSAVLLALAAAAAVNASHRGSADVIRLTDEPGNWFESRASGTPLSVVGVGERVSFVISPARTDTIHTVTLLLKPEASSLEVDQEKGQRGVISVTFDVPGVYLFIDKIHPYATGVVAVTDEAGNIPDVTATQLPFLGHLGLPSLDALSTLGVVTTVAPDDATKEAKWDVFAPGDPSLITPAVPGVGEVWVDTQFEDVPRQRKPGTITVVDAATHTVEREVFGGLDRHARGRWNNPHNMWANFHLDTIYNSNWFGRWINKIDRATGDVRHTIRVGESPTHIITNPNPSSPEFGVLHIPLSAEDDIARVRDRGRLRLIARNSTGEGRNHPHGHWLQCGRGEVTVMPNVFKGVGVAGSISLIDTESGAVLREFSFDPDDPLRSALLMPLAAGECHVHPRDGGHIHKAYIGNVVTGTVTVIDVDEREIVKNIPITLTPGGEETGFGLLDSLQLPIQTPVSPDGRWVATAVFSLTNVGRNATAGEADHVAIIDTKIDEVVAFVGTPAGTHGANWGAKLGGGYYAYITAQHANVLTVIDPDPNVDGDGSDAAVVGRVLLANGSRGAGPTDGAGGQGVKPLPMVHDGWIQPTVRLKRQGALSREVEGWINLLTPEQRNPE